MSRFTHFFGWNWKSRESYWCKTFDKFHVCPQSPTFSPEYHIWTQDGFLTPQNMMVVQIWLRPNNSGCMFTSGWKSSQLSVQFVKIENCMMALCPAVQLAEKKLNNVGVSDQNCRQLICQQCVFGVCRRKKIKLISKLHYFRFGAWKRYLGLVTFDQVSPLYSQNEGDQNPKVLWFLIFG